MHDTVLAEEIDTSTNIHSYVQKQISYSHSSDICDHHQLFHFMAIIEETYMSLALLTLKGKMLHKNTFYTPPLKQDSIKPPIV